jgi:hypothetical protein
MKVLIKKENNKFFEILEMIDEDAIKKSPESASKIEEFKHSMNLRKMNLAKLFKERQLRMSLQSKPMKFKTLKDRI